MVLSTSVGMGGKLDQNGCLDTIDSLLSILLLWKLRRIVLAVSDSVKELNPEVKDSDRLLDCSTRIRTSVDLRCVAFGPNQLYTVLTACHADASSHVINIKSEILLLKISYSRRAMYEAQSLCRLPASINTQKLTKS